MGATGEKMNLMGKLFEQALKRKLAQWSREYDPILVSKLRTQIGQNKGDGDCFNGWKWTPDMTVKETFCSLDDYLNRLQAFLRERQARNTKGIKKCH